MEPRLVAHDLLAKTAMWWEPGYVKAIHQGEERRLEPIYFRISIRKISGHQGVPGVSALTRSKMSAMVVQCPLSCRLDGS